MIKRSSLRLFATLALLTVSTVAANAQGVRLQGATQQVGSFGFGGVLGLWVTQTTSPIATAPLYFSTTDSTAGLINTVSGSNNPIDYALSYGTNTLYHFGAQSGGNSFMNLWINGTGSGPSISAGNSMGAAGTSRFEVNSWFPRTLINTDASPSPLFRDFGTTRVEFTEYFYEQTGRNIAGVVSRTGYIVLTVTDLTAAAAPEPGTLAFLALGGGLILAKRRKK